MGECVNVSVGGFEVGNEDFGVKVELDGCGPSMSSVSVQIGRSDGGAMCQKHRYSSAKV